MNRTAKGCLFGCLGFAAIVIILMVMMGVWVTRKGEFDAGTSVVSLDSDIYIRANLTKEDTKLMAFLQDFVDRTNAANSQGMPDFLSQLQQRQSRSDIDQMLPLELEWTYFGQQQDWACTVGFSFYNNIVKLGYWAMKRGLRGEGMVGEYNTREFLVLKDDQSQEDFFMSLENNVLFFASTEPAMMHALDSLDSGPWDYLADPRFRGVNIDAPVVGFLQGEEAMRFLLEMSQEDPDPATADLPRLLESEITRIAFDVRVPEVDTMIWTTHVDSPYPDNRIQQTMEQMIQSYKDQWELTVEGDVVLTPTGYKMTITFSGFADAAIGSTY